MQAQPRDPAAGGIAAGGVPAGGVSAGGVSAGGVSAGGVAAGGVSAGAVAAGGVSAGGVTGAGGPAMPFPRPSHPPQRLSLHTGTAAIRGDVKGPRRGKGRRREATGTAARTAAFDRHSLPFFPHPPTATAAAHANSHDEGGGDGQGAGQA
ncbi:unnamed protein product [Closterium sp. Naga37s-1]|nr:unnamed protein product [Closterium sp. Naga37s-1]